MLLLMIHVYLSASMEPVIHRILEAVTRRKTTLENVNWWNSAAMYPFIFLGICHLASPTSTSRLILELLMLLVFVLSYAFMIRLINDRFDIDSDALGGKRNLYNTTSGAWLDFLIVCFALLVVFIWTPLSKNPYLTIIIASFAPIAGILYSHRLIRLKERGFWAALTDSVYVFVLPSAVLISIGSKSEFVLFGACMFLWIYGLPNMLYHHLADLDHDELSNTRTFGRSYPELSKKLIKVFSLIVSLSILLALGYGTLKFLDRPYVFCIVFGLLIWTEFSRDTRSKHSYLLWIHTKWFLARQVLLAFFLCYTWMEEAYVLFGAGIILFGQLFWWRLVSLYTNILMPTLRLIRKLYFLIRKGSSLGVNYSIYWLFRLFGVNLKTLNTSAMGYFRSRLKK
ncbi:MAG: hypothetical protein CMN34_07945 [Saprospirales bacterium]|mgnify:FL=1|nr:hypothetical protein [Saprospirales bacterium]